MINITIRTERVEQMLNKIVTTIPMESDGMARVVAVDVRRGARFRERNRRRGENTKNLLWSAMDVRKIGDKQYQFFSAAPYTIVQEEGAHGWHFVPAKGKGRWGEGFAMPGGNIPSAYPHGKRFILDAYMSTYRRLPSIMRRHAERMVKK